MNGLVIMLNNLQMNYTILERRIIGTNTQNHTLLLTLDLTDDLALASYLEVYVDKAEGSAHIMNLLTVEPYLGKGYASILINHLKQLLTCPTNDITFKTVTVDDMSDRFMKSHNIYKKHGFTYLVDGLPEMVLHL